MAELFQIGLFLGLLLLGLLAGRWNERRHYDSIRRREAALAALPVMPSAEWDTDREVEAAWMVASSVVVSVDYFKRFAMGIRNLFGGNVRSYESLLDRARREAVLRVKESCAGRADIVVNLRLDTSSISGAKAKRDANSIGAVEVIASGTAVRYRRDAAPS
ncbi:MAG TPA: heavy metal-binding domain-containing protein [Candidatus Hydrogenedentes bacterium]|nr:heavy metal-binding domain-containing protein [Candidatus Hydrogenedentota bacterium]